MDNLDALKKDLETTKSLQSIISTMKSIAAVNIKKYENVVLILTNIDLMSIWVYRPYLVNILT